MLCIAQVNTEEHPACVLSMSSKNIYYARLHSNAGGLYRQWHNQHCTEKELILKDEDIFLFFL